MLTTLTSLFVRFLNKMVKVGDTFLTKRCGICTVIEYVSYVEVYVKFEDGNIVKTRVQSLGERSL